MSARRRDLPRVVAVAAEAWPYGGDSAAAEAAGALAARLHGRGFECELVLPDAAGVRRSELVTRRARREPFTARFGEHEVRGALWRCEGRDEMPVWVVTHDELYGLRAGDPQLAPMRSAFLCAAALAVARRGERPAGIVHLHGAETALAAVMLSTTHAEVPELHATRSVVTVHDPGRLALFGREILERLGLPAGLFHPQLLEQEGGVSLLKAGLVFADAIVLPSPRAAREVLRHGAGHGLESLLAERAEDLHGILHGVDETLWNPATDPQLTANFSAEKPAGKVRCKAALRAELGLATDAKAPLLGFAGAWNQAAGADLLAGALPALLRLGAQVAVIESAAHGAHHEHRELGAREGQRFDTADSGDIGARLAALAARHPGRLAVVGTAGEADSGLLRRLLAGSDVLLLPAREDPSGGLALRALRYGALPLAHAVGGLADALPAEGPGVLFRAASAAALTRAAERALAAFGSPAWKAQVRAALEQPVGWAGAARRYSDLLRALTKGSPRRIAVDALPAETDPPEPYIDWGPALPESYGEDSLGLLAQGPRSLYAYWELRPETHPQDPAGGGGVGLHLLRLSMPSGLGAAGGTGDGQPEESFELSTNLATTGEQWLAAEPGRHYQLELRTADGTSTLRSPPVATPREAPSEQRDVEWVRHAPRLQHAPEAAAEAVEPPQPLFHYGPEGMVGRFGPSAWQLAAAGNWEAADQVYQRHQDDVRAREEAGEGPFAGSSDLAPGK